MYQCFVTNEWEQIQSTAELQLGGKLTLISFIKLNVVTYNYFSDASPELVYWFSEQTLQPGPTVSLKCVATGKYIFIFKLSIRVLSELI